MTASRRRVAVIAAALMLTAAGSLAVWTVTSSARPDAAPAPVPPAYVAQVRSTTLATTQRLTGDLRHPALATLTARSAGTLTAVPAATSEPAPGDVLFRVDTSPVVLLGGSFPVWRDLSQGAKGEDVLQLERNLADLGYFSRVPDEEFLEPTTEAVKKWQKAIGVSETGVVSQSSIVFVPEPARVGSTSTALGAVVDASTVVAALTTRMPSVAVKVPLAKQALATVGSSVTVTLTDGRTTSGSISSVGQPVAEAGKQSDSGGQSVSDRFVPIEIALTDLAQLGAVQEGPVAVDLVGERHENVLAVPVDALLAQPGGGFAVEVVTDGATRSTVPVTTGLYEDALVEVSGEGLAEGTTVVSAQP